MCWYDPSDERKKNLKRLCVELVEEIRIQESQGYPDYWGYLRGCEYVAKLIKHIYTGVCEEKPC